MSRSIMTWGCRIQGVYYLLTGLWPLISIETFQAVSGRKTDHLPTGSEADHWLVNTVGVLVIAIGLSLLTGARRLPPETQVLAIAAALGLMAIDVIYVLRDVILPVYLADAAAEAVFAVLWIGYAVTARRNPEQVE